MYRHVRFGSIEVVCAAIFASLSFFLNGQLRHC